MGKYSDRLPQLSESFLTDGGLETTLIFHEGIDLPEFAAFVLLRNEKGKEALRKYNRTYLETAKAAGMNLILETATWRANPDWAEKLGFAPEELDELNRESVELIEDERERFERGGLKLVISGCIGPRGDGYVAGEMMDPEEAKFYHSRQVRVFSDSGADLVTAITMTYEDEAIGIADAAAEAEIPVVISFTVETDGRLPDGASLEEAVRKVDAAAEARPAYYMINCAHPSHFVLALRSGSGWQERIRGTRVNASKMSHAELDAAEALDEGDPDELASDHQAIFDSLPDLSVCGGCCGTDERHISAIARFLAERVSG